MANYRDRIYEYYSSARNGSLVPESIDGLKMRAPFFKKIIKDFFPKNKNVYILELGCGHGAFQYFIQQAKYINSKGIDGSVEQIEGAKKLGIRNVFLGDMIEFIRQQDDNSFDLIVAIDIFEHFNKTEFTDLVDDLYRIIKKNGRIISHQPNSEGPFGSFMKDGDYTHELSFTRQSIAQIFLSSGYSRVDSYEDKPIPHGVKSTLRYILWEFFIRKIFVFFRLVENGTCPKDSIFSQNFISIIKK